MIIKDMIIEKYIEDLSSKSPTPGGGSVAGISAVQGIALNLMVINLTLNNKKYSNFFEHNEDIKEKCEKLYSELINAADSDKIAFSKLSKAYSMPKETEEEIQLKKNALDEASLGATMAPFAVMERSLEGLYLTKELIGKSSKMAISDLGVAATMFRSASESAWLNVKINLPYLKDREIADNFNQKGQNLLVSVKKLSEEIYNKVEKEI